MHDLKITKVVGHSPDVDTNSCDTVTGILQGDILTPFLSIICLDYILQTSINLMKENGFTLKISRRRQHPADVTDTDYTDLALLTNTFAQVKSLLHSPEQTARSIGLHMN